MDLEALGITPAAQVEGNEVIIPRDVGVERGYVLCFPDELLGRIIAMPYFSDFNPQEVLRIIGSVRTDEIHWLNGNTGHRETVHVYQLGFRGELGFRDEASVLWEDLYYVLDVDLIPRSQEP